VPPRLTESDRMDDDAKLLEELAALKVSARQPAHVRALAGDAAARLSELREERDGMRALANNIVEQAKGYESRATAAEARAEKMREALQLYGRHQGACQGWMSTQALPVPCTCGLDAILAAPTP
jgi:hypothetical protein